MCLCVNEVEGMEGLWVACWGNGFVNYSQRVIWGIITVKGLLIDSAAGDFNGWVSLKGHEAKEVWEKQSLSYVLLSF